MHNDFYVYEFYILETNHVFYVGKGRGNRINEISNRNKYFKNTYKKYKCGKRKIATSLTNQEALDLEAKLINEYKSKGECECNLTYGYDGFSEGDLNPMYGVHLVGELNGFYGRKHSEETKRLISEHRKGKGARFGKDNPMYGKGFKGKDNPMYGRTGFSHPNSSMYKFQIDGEDPVFMTYKECERKFGIAFSRISETGGILHYKKNTPNKELYEGLFLEKVK